MKTTRRRCPHVHQATRGAAVVLAALVGAAQAQSNDPAGVQTVVVSATRHAMALIDAPAAMSVITREQIEQRGVDGVLDALRGETGVALQGRTISGRKTISLRGMDSRHTLVLVDGRRIAASDGIVGHSDFQGDWIPAEDIERIEVIRGPMSVLYGAEALGGVVDIITRQPGAQWAGSALLEGLQADGSRGGDGHRAAVRLAGPLGDAWRLAVSASDVRRTQVQSPADELITDLEGRHRQDAGVLLQWQVSAGQRIEVEHRAGQEERQAGSRETRGARRYYDSFTSIDRRQSSLGWSSDWGGPMQWRSLLRVYESDVDVGNVRTNGVAALRPNELQDRVAEGQVSLMASVGQLVTGGFELRDETLFNEALPGGRGDARHRAAYLQDEVALGRTLAFTVGVRHDRHDQFGNEWSPRAYAVWRPAPQWTVKGGIGHGFKAPTLKQITDGYKEDEGPNTFTGNPALKPETNDAVEIGVGWDGTTAGVQAMLFSNRVNRLIVPQLLGVVGGRAQYTFVNLDRARLQGLEASATRTLGAGFKGALNYQYLDATDGDGHRLEKRPRHTLGARLDWTRGAWDAGLHVESTSGQLLAPLVAGGPLQPVPAVTLVGAQVRWRATPAVDLGFAVDNLTDVRLADKSPLFLFAETPRTFRLSLRGRW